MEAFRGARVGQTEWDLQPSILDNLARFGFSRIRFIVLTVGDQAVDVRAQAGERPLQPGDLIRVETAGVVGGHGWGLAPMAVVRKASEVETELYGTQRQV